MNTMGTAIVKLLNDDAGVVAAVDVDGAVPRIYVGYTDQDSQGSFIIVNEQDTTSITEVAGDAGWTFGAWQLDAYADTFMAVEAIRLAVRKYLDTIQSKIIGGVEFYAIVVSNIAGIPTELNLGSPIPQRRISMSLAVKAAHPTT